MECGDSSPLSKTLKSGDEAPHSKGGQCEPPTEAIEPLSPLVAAAAGALANAEAVEQRCYEIAEPARRTGTE